ncbi:MAG: tetratricopeptide repeat protein, partial [Kiritimatiellia bacterium]|nr:tetratricopeptide repeat protein [Kiritimatiellia bacterium]
SGDVVSAHEAARWTLEIAPRDEDALKMAAQASLRAQWYPVAIQHLKALLEIRSGDPEARQMLAIAYLRVEQYARAIHLITDLIRNEPGNPVHYYNLAVCYARQNQAHETVSALQRAVGVAGAGLIWSWLGSEDFQSIRNDAIFQGFVRELSGRQSSVMVRQMDEQPPVGGILPRPPIELGPILRK